MNTDVSPENTSRYEKLAKPRARLDKNSHSNPFKVKRAALSYQITNTLNKLAQPKRKSDTNTFDEKSKNISSSTGQQKHHRLINSNESKNAQESRNKEFLLDTYARITAARNKRCSKRLHELAKPKQNNSTMKPVSNDDFDNYFRTIKKYEPKSDFMYSGQKKK